MFILDTDPGADDAMAFLIMNHLNLVPDYIVTTSGNASFDNVLRNALMLKKMLRLNTTCVKGYDTTNEGMDDYFHGVDGFANLSKEFSKKYPITREDYDKVLSLETLKNRILESDNVLYISIGPVTTLYHLIQDENVKKKITKVYMMGGGFYEFNSPHDTEFNFSRSPKELKYILDAKMQITLFPLDVTNHQTLSLSEIDELENTGAYPEFIQLLRYNYQSNIKFNHIFASVLHDVIPLLYLKYPEEFVVDQKEITLDQYAHLSYLNNGYTVKVTQKLKKNLLKETMYACFIHEASLQKEMTIL